MAQDSPGEENGPKQQKLSHKQKKALWRKEKRRKKRQEEARAREEEKLPSEQGTDQAPVKEEESDGERTRQEAERERQHQLWLEREAQAQEEFRVKREREETRRREQEEQERLIREEWEEQQRKEKEAKERKEQEKKKQEDKLNKMLESAGTSGNKKREEWHNPMAPADYSAGGEVPAATGRAAEDCPFFKKTGACRFGDRCSRKHTRPDSTTTLLIPGMFATFALDQTQRDDFDETMYLEYGEDELYKDFIEFYNDTLPEFRTLGRVVQFKVCCNHEPHLRGNVYVQYDREEDCLEAIKKFHGRFYAGKQLTCEMTPVASWKSAICGLFSRKRCPKGKHCNFLHVFPNPGREFRDADEDHHLDSLRRDQHDSRRSWRDFSERHGSVSARSWRQSSERLMSHSPPYRSRRSLRRESRSRSRERSSRRSRVRSRSRSRSRRRKRSRSRSRERSSRRELDKTSSSRNDRGSSILQKTRVYENADKNDTKNEDSDSGQESSNTDDHTPPEKPLDRQIEQEALTSSNLNSDDGKETATVQHEEDVLPTSPRKSRSPSVKKSRSRSRSKSRSPHKSSHHKHKRSHSHRRHHKKRKKRKKRLEEEVDSKAKSSSSASDTEKEELDSCETTLSTLKTQET